MRHARPSDLDRIADLLSALRGLPLKEKSHGVFYHRGQAFLHFHEDAGFLFADLRAGDDFERFSVTTDAERSTLLAEARRRAC
jgi:hypothetical protein